MTELAQDQLKNLLYYSQDNGNFYWKKSTNSHIKIGDIAGSLTEKGYRRIKIYNKLHRAHHLAWLYVYGNKPNSSIDHINGKPDDNRIVNLREYTNSQNQYNKKITKLNTTGFKGVCIVGDKYKAQARVNKTLFYLGLYKTPELASQAYEKFVTLHHGSFYRKTTADK